MHKNRQRQFLIDGLRQTNAMEENRRQNTNLMFMNGENVNKNILRFDEICKMLNFTQLDPYILVYNYSEFGLRGSYWILF